MIDVKKYTRDMEIHRKSGTDKVQESLTGTALHEFLHHETAEVNDTVRYDTFHAIDHVVVKTTVEDDEIDDKTCHEVNPSEPGAPIIKGAYSKHITQGEDIDLKEGVEAIDAEGHSIEFTVSPESIETCEVGEHQVTYTATADGHTTTVTRTIFVAQASNPVIHGLTELTVEVGEEFDPLFNVSAVDANGNDVGVTVTE